MLKNIIDFFNTKTVTLIGLLFLIFSFILKIKGIPLTIDPAWYAIIVSGIPLLYLAIYRLIYNEGLSKISSALLISIAMIAAIYIKDYFAAGEVAFIMAIGALLEEHTIEKAKRGLHNLISLKPPSGRKIVKIKDEHYEQIEYKEEIIAAEDIQIGDIFRVLPGETIPVDGIIITGNTSIDQSIITGESLPIEKTKGDEVYCGTINRFGTIDIKSTKTSENSTLQQLILLVENAELKKAPMQRMADKYASYMVPFVLMFALLVYFFKPTNALITAVTILVVFCPCAFVLATPTAIMAAIGQATKKGVIIKSGEVLEKMGSVNMIAFDKTGTLSYGVPEVSDVICLDDNLHEKDICILAASAEQKSEHPLALAIMRYSHKHNLKLKNTTDFQMSAGLGIIANIENNKIICGNEQYMTQNNIDISKDIKNIMNNYRKQGKISIIIAKNNQCIGIITLSDTMREDAPIMVSHLKQIGTSVSLITGDNQKTANYFATNAGIKNVYAEQLPNQKVDIIEALQSSGNKLCMIGDGVNDAAALKTAYVGVAMGGIGSDITIESADIVLMSDEIQKIPYLKRLSNETVKTIKTGIGISLTINFVAIILSLMNILEPWSAAIVHNAGSVLVVLFAAHLYEKEYTITEPLSPSKSDYIH